MSLGHPRSLGQTHLGTERSLPTQTLHEIVDTSGIQPCWEQSLRRILPRHSPIFATTRCYSGQHNQHRGSEECIHLGKPRCGSYMTESNLSHFLSGCAFAIWFEGHLHNLIKLFSKAQKPAELEKVFMLLFVNEFEPFRLDQGYRCLLSSNLEPQVLLLHTHIGCILFKKDSALCSTQLLLLVRLRGQAHNHCDCARSQDRLLLGNTVIWVRLQKRKPFRVKDLSRAIYSGAGTVRTPRLEASSGARSDPEILAMETPQDSRQSFQKPLSLGAEEDQEQQHGE